MILDKVLNGILDQNAGCLEIFEPSESGVRFFLPHRLESRG